MTNWQYYMLWMVCLWFPKFQTIIALCNHLPSCHWPLRSLILIINIMISCFDERLILSQNAIFWTFPNKIYTMIIQSDKQWWSQYGHEWNATRVRLGTFWSFLQFDSTLPTAKCSELNTQMSCILYEWSCQFDSIELLVKLYEWSHHLIWFNSGPEHKYILHSSNSFYF